MYGGMNKGQVVEERSALLASRGFASLALAFFGAKDLPKNYFDLGILMFYQKLTYLMKSPKSIFLKRQFLLYHKFHNVVLENIHMLLYSIVDKRKRRKVLEVWDPDLKVQITIEYVL